MVQEERPLSELAAIMIRYPQVLINFAVARKTPLQELSSVSTVIARVEKALGQDGRVLVRYSGTESKARVMIEGTDENTIRDYAEEIVATMQKALAQ
jgi:phosphoglucosamine mutase